MNLNLGYRESINILLVKEVTVAKIITVDFLFKRLCQDVSDWYDKYYFGRDKEQRKNIHLMILEDKYYARSFSTDPVERGKEVRLFLEVVQNSVDGYTF